VDDLDGAVISPGCLVALSAAMPGLVGAVMRRNSPYASFREAISHPGQAGDEQAQEPASCLVRVKLFNAVMREWGPELLSRGILLEPSRIAESLGIPPLSGYTTGTTVHGYLLLKADGAPAT
jgi:hypothetical protein